MGTAMVTVALALLLAIGSSGNVGAVCDETDLLYKSLPCVAAGGLMSVPTAQCCQVAKAMPLDCLCRLIVSSAGASSDKTTKSYIKTCKINAPPGFKC